MAPDLGRGLLSEDEGAAGEEEAGEGGCFSDWDSEAQAAGEAAFAWSDGEAETAGEATLA